MLEASQEAIRDMQWLSRTHPELRDLCDKVISVILVQNDKLRKQEAER